MRRQAQMLHHGELSDLAALPESAAEREIGLHDIDCATIDQPLEIESGVKRLAGRDRHRAPALQQLIAGKILRSQRLLDPTNVIWRHSRDALARDIQRVVGIDIDQDFDVGAEDAAGRSHALLVIGRGDADLDLDRAMTSLGHGLDLRLEIARTVFGEIATRGIDLHLVGLLAADQPVHRQTQHFAGRILGGHVDAGNAPGHGALHTEVIMPGQHQRIGVLDIVHIGSDQIALYERQHGQIDLRHAPAFADAFGPIGETQTNQRRRPRRRKRLRHSVGAAGGKLRLQRNERDVVDNHAPSHAATAANADQFRPMLNQFANERNSRIGPGC
jgi:hypothetical protein